MANNPAQRAHRQILDLEKRLIRALDNLPNHFLGVDSATTQALQHAAAQLGSLVELLEQVAEREGRRYLESGAADATTPAEQVRAVRHYIARAKAVA